MMVVVVVEIADIAIDVLGLIRLAERDNIPKDRLAQLQPEPNEK